MNIFIRTITHESQAYETCGNWQFVDKELLVISVSEMGDWRSEIAVAIHEVVEALACSCAGISQQEVDRFDLQFEHDRVLGRHTAEAEPGAYPDAPYRKEHAAAEVVERAVCAAFEIGWQEHEARVEAL